ncbi:CLUMA_CG004949, isoform A [Clunio marinus]|uniref:CLUMA_CG004949, isoform A n=1 Tax=Clunio marinus TaxID=568069 RepID=A0A1J1HXM0_9DIPT|nr:CLUMA_CG004949, isoform A [Clunio marinus]
MKSFECDQNEKKDNKKAKSFSDTNTIFTFQVRKKGVQGKTKQNASEDWTDMKHELLLFDVPNNNPLSSYSFLLCFISNRDKGERRKWKIEQSETAFRFTFQSVHMSISKKIG